jgi:hypothetical protein
MCCGAHGTRQAQNLVDEEEPMPALSSYSSPYDRFKREGEEIIARVCEEETRAGKGKGGSGGGGGGGAGGGLGRAHHTHLRVSGIFSNCPSCIQMRAIALQVGR